MDAPAPARSIELWFDFASPYSYLSVMRIEAAAARCAVPVVWQPFLLGPIFQAAGWSDSPFVLLPAKGRHMWIDLARQCRKRGLPWQQPQQFPKRCVLATRVALLGRAAPWMGEFCRAAMQANFVHDLDLDAPEVIAALLAQLGLPGGVLITAACSEEQRLHLRAQNAQAVAKGIFGAPSLFVGAEMYWGDDRLDDALRAAAGLPEGAAPA
jgi:2-hydroxychromene-2-carboxylate isomerase